MILVCPVRPGDKNEELRYAMRSWETNLLYPKGLTLVTVGHRPSWLEPDHHIEGNRYESLPFAVWDNVLLASREILNHEAIYMNDDFFCMDPMPGIVPVRRNISLAEHCRIAGGSGWWGQSLDLTASWLSDQGYPSPDSFEVHRPLLAQPAGMVLALEKYSLEGASMVPQWRTVYGTLNEVDAAPVADVKVGNRAAGAWSPWLSTSDASWRLHAATLTKRFQKPSRWET